ncbi:MAG: membrane protein insertase YidC [Actinomycetales bacterium]|nr:membrane protein insertase YidC [Actinomycetales bacterium]
MDFSAFPPIAALLDGAHSLLLGLAAALEPLAGSASAALAIVLVTLVVRAALVPLGVRLVRADLARRRLAPRLAELQRRHRARPEVLQQKTLELYRAEGVSPFAGILPALAQAPVLGVLYGVAVSPQLNGHANELLGATLLGAPLGRSLPLLLAAGAWPQLLVPLTVVAVVALVAALTRRQSLAWQAAGAAAAGRSNAGAGAAGSRSNAGAAASAAAPGAGAMPGLARALSWMPFLTVAFAAFVPLAAALYLAVSTAWTLVERGAIRRVLTRGGEPGPVATARPAATPR